MQHNSTDFVLWIRILGSENVQRSCPEKTTDDPKKLKFYLHFLYSTGTVTAITIYGAAPCPVPYYSKLTYSIGS
jgi:hypothetical protein